MPSRVGCSNRSPGAAGRGDGTWDGDGTDRTLIVRYDMGGRRGRRAANLSDKIGKSVEH
ncbi:hypothetical protein Cme02nite_13710 [Catellatospora methionotrophica]|uniref:Uncharacterized protein n=1 Tax=Catellatospora methionotrophica TaxID=121620 RepID=A0A8J3PDU7_9ACTN|nr:hypothetical protein Cme02nite_13710 [Catellatospora methionotrophica]